MEIEFGNRPVGVGSIGVFQVLRFIVNINQRFRDGAYSAI